jgi:hypothetical protein
MLGFKTRALVNIRYGWEGFMPAPSSLKSAGRGLLSVSLAMLLFAALPARGQTLPQRETVSGTTPKPQQSPKTGVGSAYATPTEQALGRGGHAAETNPGRTPHASSNSAAIGEAVGAATAAVMIGELIAHHNASPQKLGQEGPQVRKEFDMNEFVVKGLVRPNWPVVLDFMIDGPGTVHVEIIADKHRHEATLNSKPNHRGYLIFRLPENFGAGLQTAIYKVTAVGPNGNKNSAPQLRTYGLGAGDKAVGSVAIDQLTFQPATIHPKAKEVADYGFHAHSAFDSVRAEFIFTTLYNGHLLVQKDQEDKLAPVPEGERPKGTWNGNGKAGEHMLQIRAWRGYQNGGDWVVAWSPDIVDVVK